MDLEKVKDKVNDLADIIIENKDYLTELDREIGDADHGYNMAKGFSAVKGVLSDEYPSIKALVNKIAMTLISNVGGASGPLYGSFFMKFAQGLNDEKEISKEDFIKAFNNGLDGVIMRGKAKLGDKTMVDVLCPVSTALLDNKSFEEVLKIAEDKMNETKDMGARKGRASYLGERSKGHIDPGAYSSYLMIKSILEA